MKIQYIIIPLAIALILSLSVTALQTPEFLVSKRANVLFYLNFEDTLISQQGDEPLHQQGIEFTQGALGHGLQLGGDTELDYATESISINKDYGAFSFWIRQEYDQSHEHPGYENYHYYMVDLFDRYEGGNSFSRHRMSVTNDREQNLIVIEANPHSDGGPEVTGIYQPFDWENGDMHHIVYNYDMSDKIQLYIDGQPVAEANDNLPNELAELPRLINIGYYKDTHAHHYPGMIDELKIWDRPLTHREAYKEYARIFHPSLSNYQP